MAKKRTSLDSLFESTEESSTPKAAQSEESEKSLRAVTEPTNARTTVKNVNEANQAKGKSATVKQTVYLPPAVHEQLRQLAFEERRKMHDYLVEGLDRVFKNRGLKSYAELFAKTDDR